MRARSNFTLISTVLAALSAACFITSCTTTTAKPVSDDVSAPSGDGRGDVMRAPDGTPLPPGVMPPSENPPPGAARLGPDGHYDYEAADFVLQDPCDSQELMGRLKAMGYEEVESIVGRDNLPWQRGCLIGTDHLATAGFNAQDYNFSDLHGSAYPIEVRNEHGQHWYEIDEKSAMAEICFSAVETEVGLLGFAVPFGEKLAVESRESACSTTTKLIKQFLEG